jgi:hypothetical protein
VLAVVALASRVNSVRSVIITDGSIESWPGQMIDLVFAGLRFNLWNRLVIPTVVRSVLGSYFDTTNQR